MILSGRMVRPLVIGYLVGGAAVCTTHTKPDTAYNPMLGLAAFDTAWTAVKEFHFDTTFNGVDWDGVREELRPEAAAAGDVGALRSVIEKMLSTLGQSHFSLIPGEYAGGISSSDNASEESSEGDPGMDVRLIDNVVVVSRVDSGGPAAAAGIRPGWILISIDGESIEDQVKLVHESPAKMPPKDVKVWQSVVRHLMGPSGSARRLELLEGSGTSIVVDVVLGPKPGEPVNFGNLPTIYARFSGYLVDSGKLGIEVGVIRFNTWMAALVNQVNQAVSDYRNCDGIVIDLRGNTGGLAAMVMGVAGHFYDERTTLGVMQTRQNELRFFANPRLSDPLGNRVDPYTGSVAILIDEVTASASEILAGGMQATGRARVFGTTSMGAVLPALTKRLPNDDVLYYAFGDFTTAAGVRLEGRGVIPDVVVPTTREDLLNGRDAPLVAALRWIAGQQEMPGEAPVDSEERR